MERMKTGRSARVLCLLLALVLAVSLMAGCSSTGTEETGAAATESGTGTGSDATQAPEGEGGEAPEAGQETSAISFPLDEEVEFTIATAVAPFAGNLVQEMNDFTLFREMEARTNVMFTGTMLAADAAMDTINTIIASGDYPDIFPNLDSYSSNGNYQAYLDGVIIDLTDYIAEYGPNMTAALADSPETRIMLTYQDENGEDLYLNYFLLNEESITSNISGLQYRGDWLEELNMDVPTNLSEFEAVVEAFYVNYGATLYFGNESTGLPISTALNNYVALEEFGSLSLPAMVIDGQVVAGFMQDEFLTYLTYASEWYEAGYLDPDYISGTNTADQESGAISAGEIGIYTAGISAYSMNNDLLEQESTGGHLVAGNILLDETGNTHIAEEKSLSRNRQWSVSSTCENVEILTAWVDYLFSDEGYILFNYGVEGEGLQYNEAGEPELTDLVLNNPDGQPLIATEYVYCQNEASNIPGILYMDKNMTGYSDEEMEVYEMWKQGVGDSEYRIPKGVQLTSEQSERVNAIYGDLSTYFSEMIAMFVTGAASLDEFDAFREQLVALGINDIVAVYQEAYDTYVERLAALEG